MKNKILSIVLSILVLASSFGGMFLFSVAAEEQYRYSTIYDFENMTDERATALFTKRNGCDATFSIVEDSGQKALKMNFKSDYSGGAHAAYSRYWINIPVPKDDHLVGMRVHFKGYNLNGGRLQLLYNGSWKNTDFLTGDVAENNKTIDEVDKTIIFNDKSKDVGEGRNNEFHFLLRSFSNNQDAGIIVYEIDFVYDNPYDGYTETVEDFETMTGDEATEYMKQNGTNDSSGISYTYSIAANQGYNNTNGLKVEKIGDGSINHRGPKIDLSDKKIIGMRLYYHIVEKIGAIRLQIVDTNKGTWTDVDFTNNRAAMEIGLYDRVVMLDDKTVDRNSKNLHLAIEVSTSNNNSVIIDEIQYIYAFTTVAFVDTFEISGSKDISTAAGAKGDAVVFPETLIAVSDYSFAGWSKTEGGAALTGDTFSTADATYYAVWNPGLAALRKVLLGAMETPASVNNNINGDANVDILDLIRLKKDLANRAG